MTKTYNSLTLAQRISIIDKYIKVAFTRTGETTYEMPRLTMAQMAEAATEVFGFKVTPQNVQSCIDTMGELGFEIVKPVAATESNKARIEDLEQRVAVLEAALEEMRRMPMVRPLDLDNPTTFGAPGLPFPNTSAMEGA